MTESISYRVYFRGRLGIQGRHDFVAESDEAALAIAGILWDACSDVSTEFELWDGARRVFPADRPREEAILRKAEEAAIAYEEAIQRSEWAIAQSRRLLDRLNAARAVKT